MADIQAKQESIIVLKDRLTTTIGITETNKLLATLGKLASACGDKKDVFYSKLLACSENPKIKNVPAYLTSIANALVSELKTNETTKERKNTICFTELHLAMNKASFVGELKDKFLIDNIERYSVLNLGVPLEEMQTLNMQIIAYCEKNDLLTYEKFYKLLLKSKLLYGKDIPFEELKQNAIDNAKEWVELIEYEGEVDITNFLVEDENELCDTRN